MAPEFKGINKFSADSRRRLQIYLAQIDRTQLKPGIFITLTIPDPPDDVQIIMKWQNRFNTSLKKDGQFAAIWKKEYTIREDGKIHWHFHYMIFAAKFRIGVNPRNKQNFIMNERVEYLWHKAMQSLCMPSNRIVRGKPEWMLLNDETYKMRQRYPTYGMATETEPMQSWNGVAFYVTKYMTKELDPAEHKIMNTGRFWGVLNKKLIPVSEDFFLVTKDSSHRIRRIIRRLLNGKSFRLKGKSHIYLSQQRKEIIGKIIEECSKNPLFLVDTSQPIFLHPKNSLKSAYLNKKDKFNGQE